MTIVRSIIPRLGWIACTAMLAAAPRQVAGALEAAGGGTNCTVQAVVDEPAAVQEDPTADVEEGAADESLPNTDASVVDDAEAPEANEATAESTETLLQNPEPAADPMSLLSLSGSPTSDHLKEPPAPSAVEYVPPREGLANAVVTAGALLLVLAAASVYTGSLRQRLAQQSEFIQKRGQAQAAVEARLRESFAATRAELEQRLEDQGRELERMFEALQEETDRRMKAEAKKGPAAQPAQCTQPEPLEVFVGAEEELVSAGTSRPEVVGALVARRRTVAAPADADEPVQPSSLRDAVSDPPECPESSAALLPFPIELIDYTDYTVPIHSPGSLLDWIKHRDSAKPHRIALEVKHQGEAGVVGWEIHHTGPPSQGKP